LRSLRLSLRPPNELNTSKTVDPPMEMPTSKLKKPPIELSMTLDRLLRKLQSQFTSLVMLPMTLERLLTMLQCNITMLVMLPTTLESLLISPRKLPSPSRLKSPRYRSSSTKLETKPEPSD
jgi:hypothetical protein